MVLDDSVSPVLLGKSKRVRGVIGVLFTLFSSNSFIVKGHSQRAKRQFTLEVDFLLNIARSPYRSTFSVES